MAVQPSFDAFQAAYDAGRPQVVWSSLVADLETPISAYLKLANGNPNSFLLESVHGGAIRGRYSIIGLKPDVIWRCHGDHSEINRKAATDPAAFEPAGPAPASLRALLAESRMELPPELPPMAAGVVGYMGYDMVRLVERLGPPGPDKLGVPDGLFVRPTVMAIFDVIKDTITTVTPVRPQPGVSAEAAY